MSQRKFAWTALALAAILFVGINIFVDNFFTDTRLDLTQAGTYTLSDGTRAIIAKLPEPVTLRLYFARKNSADCKRLASYLTGQRGVVRLSRFRWLRRTTSATMGCRSSKMRKCFFRSIWICRRAIRSSRSRAWIWL